MSRITQRHLKLTAERPSPEEWRKQEARRVAVLIGNGVFPDEADLQPLQGPANDVRELSKLLGAEDIGDFEVQSFIDVDSYSILPILDELLATASAGDLILIYYSGHGKLSISGQLCLATRNTRVSTLQTTSISLALLKGLIENSPAGRIVLIFDCCFSGAAAKAFLRGGIDEQLQITEGAGIHILTSATSIQSSMERETEGGGEILGDFTRAFIEGIRSGKADVDTDGLISLRDISVFLQSKLRHQTPKYWGFDASGEIFIAHNPAPRFAKLPEDLQSALESRFVSVREGAVRSLEHLCTSKNRGLATAALRALTELCHDDSRCISSLAQKIIDRCSNPEHEIRLASEEDSEHRQPQFTPGIAAPPKLRLCLDSWIGWRTVFLANGGLKTKPGSIYDRLGLDLEVNVVDDNELKVAAFREGHIQAMGSTINRFALELHDLREAGIQARMVLITNSSQGGDGIIAKEEIQSIEDLASCRIAVARRSEAHCFLAWCLLHSSLPRKAFHEVCRNLVYASNGNQAAKAFFNNEVDAAATWQPFLTQATESTEGHVLASTRTINNFIFDGISFSQDILLRHEDLIAKFVHGFLEAANTGQGSQDNSRHQLDQIVEVFPSCALLTSEQIAEMCLQAPILGASQNLDYLDPGSGLATYIFEQSSAVWKLLGEAADPSLASLAFEDKFVRSFVEPPGRSASGERNKNRSVKHTQGGLNTEGHVIVSFQPGKWVVEAEYRNRLAVLSGAARIAGRASVEIRGHADASECQSTEDCLALASKRARSVAIVLQYEGIQPQRMTLISIPPHEVTGRHVDVTVNMYE